MIDNDLDDIELAVAGDRYSYAEDTLRLVQEVKRLRRAIRKHRDERGDDRCWLDDETLYGVLPEGFTPPTRDTRVEKSNCDRFISSRHNPRTEYTSPQKRIEELEAELKEREADYTSCCEDRSRLEQEVKKLTLMVKEDDHHIADLEEEINKLKEGKS